MKWIVIIEKDGEDPITVWFDTLDEGAGFTDAYNLFAQEAWPSSFHNYARPPQLPSLPRDAIAALVKEIQEEPET